MASSRYAVAQLAKKLRMEAAFSATLRAFFLRVNRTAVTGIRESGVVPPLTRYREELTRILREHYKDTASAFQGDASQTITKSLRDIETKQEELPDVGGDVTDRMRVAGDTRAPVQAGYILNTQKKDADAITAKILAEAYVAGIILTSNELARQVEQELTARIPDRVDVVSVYETQWAAETTKHTEARALLAATVAVGTVILATATRKVWNTILDERTRDSHVLADLQERTTDEGFTVQGQTLMYPGDTSHGASLDNVINCRCASEYVLRR